MIYVPRRINVYAYSEQPNGIDEATGRPRTASQQQAFLEGGGEGPKALNFWLLLKNRRAMMASVSSIFAMIFMLFTDTIFTNYALSVGVSEDYIGFVFAMPCLVYTISAPLVGLLCKRIRRMYLTQVAFLLSFVGLVLLGPSEVFGLPQTLGLILTGFNVLGFAISLIFVPLLSEVVDAVKEKEGLTEESDQLNDLASGFFNTSYAIGCLLAPVLGGVL